MNERQESARPGPAPWDKHVALMVALALLGAWISRTLTGFHLSDGQSGSAVFRRVCEIGGGGCEQILQSSWAMLPRSIPLAWAGLVYFSTIALWYLVVGRANRTGRGWYVPVFALQLLGGLVSVFLLGVMLVQMRALCAWCVLVHVINFVLLGLAWKLWPRGPRAAGAPPWPPARLAVAALLLVVAVAAYWNQRLVNSYLQTGIRLERAEAERFRSDLDLMRYLFFRGRPQEIPLRADEAGGGSAPHTVVVFSDFQCPGCRQFAAFFEREIRPSFGDRVRLVYKHFPFDTDCNAQVPRTFHDNACEAAYAAEAARELGGPQGFWKLHDALFERAADVAAGRWTELAAGAGLDGAAVAERVAQRTHRSRITKDVQLASALKLRETPSVFVDGRLLEDWTRRELWEAILAPPAATPEAAPAAGPDA